MLLNRTLFSEALQPVVATCEAGLLARDRQTYGARATLEAIFNGTQKRQVLHVNFVILHCISTRTILTLTSIGIRTLFGTLNEP